MKTSTLDTAFFWYVVYCNPLKEFQVAQALKGRSGVVVYLPELHLKMRDDVRVEPLFPRYIFVQANLQQFTPSVINATPGVTYLVTIENVPQSISHDIIEALRQRVDEINAEQSLWEQRFKAGDVVRFVKGPMQGLEAVFVEALKPEERARVLVEFLGEQRTAFVDTEMLELTSSEPEERPKRRTRGRGRKIKLRERLAKQQPQGCADRSSETHRR